MVALRYEVVAFTRTGSERVHAYSSDTALGPGDVLRQAGRDWLVERVESSSDPPRLVVKPARYRLRLRHPDGHEELGAFRRWRSDAPGVGHSFSTIEDRLPVAWTVTETRLARDEQEEPYLDVVAERDFGELEGLPNHELEHALANRDDEVPAAAQATLARAEQAGLAVELVALEVGEEPDWPEAERYIVKDRLRSDLERFRADIEGDHDDIEEWDFRDGRIFASVGTTDDEANPDAGHGWMSRLVDSGVLTVAGFRRVRKTEI